MLSPQDRDVINRCPSVQTNLGIVVVLNFSHQFPQGWERLSYQEAQQHGIIEQLKTILAEWSIVAFQQGKMAGKGYGYEIQPTYGGECGEGFILKRGAFM
jgi:hypothetical protein